MEINIIILNIALCTFFIILSGLFSGLTLGLLSLDKVSLNIIMNSNVLESKYAKAIYPVRQNGNLLLCTLLLGNVAVNSALAIILTDFVESGIIGLVVSTTLIVIFGEIIPQSTCSRHSLYIGYKTIWITKFLKFILWPIAFPMAVFLNKIFGDEIGMVYTNKQLKELVKIYEKNNYSELQERTARMMTGALDFDRKSVKDVMIKWNDIFMLDINERLTFDILFEIFKKGHSRIPIYMNIGNNQQNIVGLLFVKDLIMLNPNDEIPISTIVNIFQHDILKVTPDYKLTNMLKDFSLLFFPIKSGLNLLNFRKNILNLRALHLMKLLLIKFSNKALIMSK